MAEWVTYDELTAVALNEKSVYVGSGAPGTITDGMVWVDISTNPPVLKTYDLTNTQWLTHYPIIYEDGDTGAWSDPVYSPAVNGTIVVSYNDDQGAVRLYMYANGGWEYLATADSPLLSVYDAVSSGTVSDSGGTLTFASDRILNIDYKGVMELQMYSDDNSAWFDISSDYEPRILVIPGGKLRIINNGGAGDTYKHLEITPPGGVSWDQGVLADDGTVLMAAGLNSFYVAEASVGDMVVQYYYSAAWQDQTEFTLSSDFTIWSDGTNIRIQNQSGGSIRYVHAYQTSAQ